MWMNFIWSKTILIDVTGITLEQNGKVRDSKLLHIKTYFARLRKKVFTKMVFTGILGYLGS